MQTYQGVKMKHLDLFSGIGGFALAADRVFGEVEHTFCEIDPFCQEVLKKHWPKSKIYEDIRTLIADTEHTRRLGTEEARTNSSPQPEGKTRTELPLTELEGGGLSRTEETRWDLLTGGFPCQPFSQAGRRKGTEDDRYLWPEMLRVIREFHPRWIIGENVGGFVTWSEGMVLEQVHADLEGEGYEVQSFIIPAVAVNAPHRRDRVWIVANNKYQRPIQRKYEERPRQEERIFKRDDWERPWLEVATKLCRVDDGIPRRMDRNPRLKALGNAIVPQVAEEIFKAIKASEMPTEKKTE